MADDNSAQTTETKEKNPLIEIVDHVTLITSAKAIKTDIGEHGMSDDDLPKVLTTLETVKKPAIETEDDNVEIELCPYEEDDDGGEEENAILLEVYNDEIDSTLKDIDGTVDAEHSNEMQQNGSTEIKNFSFPKIGSEILIKRVNEKPQKSDDLIAILEGEDDNTEHYKVDIPAEPKKLSDEEAREIALQQMMNLPKKKKGRPRLNPEGPPARKKKPPKSSEHLVKDLMGDWSDDQDKSELGETEFVVEFANNENGITEINTISPANEKGSTETTFKRSRVVKKKVIWDPDAPETAIHYASFAHITGPGNKRKLPVKRVSGSSETASDVEPNSPMSKRKKLSEIDKLLGDEGAANMLSSLNQSNNGSSNAKSSRSKTIKTDQADAVDSKATISPKDTKDNSIQKRNATPTKIGKKRGPKKASSTWDYVYSSRPDDCMIIRRRSNSSYSSTTSLNRLSIDAPSAPPIFDEKDSQFEFTKPNVPIKVDSDTDVFEDNKNIRGRKRKSKSNGIEISYTDFKEITVSKCKMYTKITLNKKHGGKLSINLMKEIENVLRMLDNDDSCNLVLFVTEDNMFFNEIDASSVDQLAQDKRKIAAIELCKMFGGFIHSIIDFKKVIVLGLKGQVHGLGLALTLLFDIVIAQNICTFGTFSSANQQRIEGSSIITTSNKLSYNTKTELLYFNESLNAEKAKENNIITRIVKSSEFDRSVQQICQKLSSKNMGSVKQQLQGEEIQKFKMNIQNELKQLLQYWCE